MSDEIQEGDRPRKKKALPRNEDAPRKKKAPPPPDDDEEEEEEERPRKRRKRHDDEEGSEDLGNSPLAAIIPLGTNIWALLAFWLALVSCLVPGLWLFALLCAVLSFVTQKFKLSYGSITGNLRAVLGIFISLGAMVFHVVLFIMWYKKLL